MSEGYVPKESSPMSQLLKRHVEQIEKDHQYVLTRINRSCEDRQKDYENQLVHMERNYKDQLAEKQRNYEDQLAEKQRSRETAKISWHRKRDTTKMS
jgi:hypothetical protein